MRDVESPVSTESKVTLERFVYAGVDFEVHADGPFDVGDEHRTFSYAPDDGPSFAHVRCNATFDPALEHAPWSTAIEWQWSDARARVTTSGVRAELHRRSASDFDASGRVRPWSAGPSALVSALATAIVERESGLVLHAAGIVLEGRAHLFVGPSGAGKTTAAHHCPGASWVARDRAAVVPCDGGYRTWGLAGGDPIDLPQTRAGGLPLAGIYRIRRDREHASLERLHSAKAAFVVRESTFSGGGIEEEPLRWEAIERLLQKIPVVDLHTRLGEPLTELLRKHGV